MEQSELISTNFEVNPYIGAVHRGEFLCRYLSMDKFEDLLRSESLWFTRVHNWKKDDPCEAILLPVFRNALFHPSKNKEAIDWEVADLELGLKSSFGCSFIKDDGYEKAHMWSIYCPEDKRYGVKIKIRADRVYNAVQAFPEFHLACVDYMNDIDANNMTIKDTKHSWQPENPAYFNAWESLFYKRKAYEAEKEVRAVISRGCFRASYLLWFAGRHGLAIYQYDEPSFYAEMRKPVPKDILWIGFQDHEGRFLSLSLDMPRTSQLIKSIDEQYEETFPTLKEEKGIRIGISLNDIEAIIVHPSICNDEKMMQNLMQLSDQYGLSKKIVESELAKSRWY